MNDPSPKEGFFPVVYDELRRLARAKLRAESPWHTLNATALVHEAYLRLGEASFGDRGEFFRAAAVAMQHILVDHVRSKRAAKRGGSANRFLLDERDRIVIPAPDLILDIDTAINLLAAEDPKAADVARLRLFAGLSVQEAAEVLDLSRASAFREWAYARAYLSDFLAARKNEELPSDH